MPNAHPHCGAATAGSSPLDIGDIFRRHKTEATRALVLDPLQKRVLERISTCRTAVLGGHMQACMHCGFEQPAYNSCRDRHCPKCQATRQAKWVALRLERILPVEHFHVVFTLPGQLRPFAAANPELAYNLLLRAASQTLMKFGHDPKWLGAQLGLTVILHTWRRDLAYHPHVHCVVTDGGLSKDALRWVEPRYKSKFLFPVAALAQAFKGKFLAALHEHDPHTLRGIPSDPRAFEKLFDRLHRMRWHVYVKRPLGGGEHIFKYLGRYTHRVAISNQRLISVTDTRITFATKDGKQTTVAPLEFIKRFLQHVLPEGFTKIRHYGLYAGPNVEHRLLDALRLLTPPPQAPSDDQPAQVPDVTNDDILTLLFGADFLKCPACKVGRLVPVAHIPPTPNATGPP